MAATMAVVGCVDARGGSGPSAATIGGGEATASSSTTGGTEPTESSGATGDVDDGSGSAGETSDASTGVGESTETGAMEACATELEDFATQPDWVAKNLPDGKNDYGWSPGTTHAGGAPGEIGGRFQRSSHRSSYAHVIPAKDGASCISASGILVIPRKDNDFRSRISVGHFDGLDGPHVGFDLADEDGGRVRVFVKAGGLSELAFEMNQVEVARTWAYAWDPVAGTMTLTIDGVGTVVRPLGAGQVGEIHGLDRFGIRQRDYDEPQRHPGVMKLYLDEIEYTR